MSRSIEQNLLSLMPTHGNQLPPSLVDTARTLLTQSRQRASTLKADEEIARMYACAHIACERWVASSHAAGPPKRRYPHSFRTSLTPRSRLKIRLNLPPIEARPPIPPRVYKRLFTHLDNILPGRQIRANTLTPKTPKNTRDLGSAVRRSEPRALDRSVSRSATQVTPKQITLVDTPTKSTSKGFVGRIDPAVGLRPWVRAVLGMLITEAGRQRWGRLVLEGVKHVLAPGNKRTADPWVDEHLPATVAAIFATCMYAVDKIVAGAKSNAKVLLRGDTIDIMKRAKKELDVKGMSDEEFWDGWTGLSEVDVIRGMQRVEKEWAGEWFDILLDAAEAERDAKEREAQYRTFVKTQSPQRAPARLRKADMMHLDKFSFLSPEKQEAYAEWEADVLSRIDAAEGSDSSESASADT